MDGLDKLLMETETAVMRHEANAKLNIESGDYLTAIEYAQRLDDLKRNLIYFIEQDLPE